MNVAALDAVYIAVFFHCFSTFSSIGITFAQNDSNFGPNERLGVIRFYPKAIAIMRQTCSVPSNEKPIDFLSSYSIFFFAIYSDLVYALCFAKKHQCQTERINCRFPLLNTNKAKCSPPKMFAYIRNSYIEFEFALFCLEIRLDMSR